ncbi:hypothetical protein BD324DRAFT_651769 [Kockovaella imperatae]|uniref:Oxidized purine nucleoside triphosphate hydrolase n=1 Tax=Kockovaella imperatae TaxID=4999 RepID=A0A1Y1UCV4_9TREE|nr:hypothetical protein BD324DRAFT_651769 [Kockovaella imperatae]ORX35853.1 hypothetical protein BD324DRAFT_651769 [Kockovaella imperatae]
MAEATSITRHHGECPLWFQCEGAKTLREPHGGWTTAPEPIREFSLIFVVDKVNRRVLLGKKRRGVGVGLYNGFGGKPEAGETILECAKRELREESCLVPSDAAFSRVGHFVFGRPKHGNREIFRIVIFGCTSWTGEPEETDEMTAEWFDIPSEPPQATEEGYDQHSNGYPLSNMWPEETLFHFEVLQHILQTHSQASSSSPKELVGQLEYDYIDPATEQAWTLIKPHHANDPTLPEGKQEALIGWCFGWRDRSRS